MKSLNKIKTLDIINKFGTKTKCYLTGTPIDLEKDNYCFDHIVPYINKTYRIVIQ